MLKKDLLRKLGAFAVIGVFSASVVACGNTKEESTASSVSSVLEESTSLLKDSSAEAKTVLTQKDIKPFIKGMDDMSVTEGTKDFDPLSSVTVDKNIIKGINADTSKVELDKAGKYTVTYTVVVDDDNYNAYKKDTFSYKGDFTKAVSLTKVDADAVSVKIEKNLTITAKDDKTDKTTTDSKTTSSAKTDVKTSDTVNKSNSSAAVTAVATTAPDTSSSAQNTVSSNTADTTSNSENTSKTNTSTDTTSNSENSSKSDTSTNTNTPKPVVHTHKYTEIITKNPSCAEAGIKTLTCNDCGDTKTEVISATGEHEYIVVPAKTHTEDQGHYETVTTEAYDEITQSREPVCNQCGYIGKEQNGNSKTKDIGIHIAITEGCNNYSVKWVEIPVHHDAVTEEVWVPNIITIVDEEAYEVCSVCGTRK